MVHAYIFTFMKKKALHKMEAYTILKCILSEQN